MSNIDKQEGAPETIDLTRLDEVTGGCGRCRCGTQGGGGAYSQRSSFGVDPLVMIFAMQLFSQQK